MSEADVKDQAIAKGSLVDDRPRERLRELLDGGCNRDSNVIFDVVTAMSELVVHELVGGEQADFLSGRGHDQRRGL